VGGLRAILITEDALRGVLIDVRKSLGTGGEAMLYHFGVELGREWARYVLREAEGIGVKPLEEKANIACDIFTSLGYGKIEISEFTVDPPHITFKIDRNIECSLAKTARAPFSHFIRGTLAGFATELFKREMFAEEVRCIAQGDSLCKFDIKPKKRTL
jgi:predicted hydrocarbon binding protein